MKEGDKFIYTSSAADWRFGLECQIIGEVGGCWIVRAIERPSHTPIWINKSSFPMPNLTPQEIERKKRAAMVK